MKLDKEIAAIITGGASGLGEATARALSARGVRVALFDRDREKGEALAKELGAVFCETDVSDEASVDGAFGRSRGVLGEARILVCCAGVGYAQKTASRDRATGNVIAHDVGYFSRTVEINLIGTFRCLSKAAAGMLSLEALAGGERGVIVNTASIAAEDGQIGQVAYSASKGGIVGMTLPAARDLSREGVRVCAILPGLFDTPLFAGAPEEMKRKLGSQVPFPSRLGLPSEYAALVLHICENVMLNGASLRLDGALRMPPR